MNPPLPDTLSLPEWIELAHAWPRADRWLLDRLTMEELGEALSAAPLPTREVLIAKGLRAFKTRCSGCLR